MKKVASNAVLIFLLISCQTPSAERKEFIIGNEKISYVMQSCKPNIKWDGMNIVLEGINVPKTGTLAFSIGKIDYSDKAIREINSMVFYYDGLLTAVCQTLVRLDKEELILKYSQHRDALLSNLASTLGALENTSNEHSVEEISTKAKIKADAIDSSFNTSANGKQVKD